MTVVVAPDKFKGSLTASEVAAHLIAGLSTMDLPAVAAPVADGGDGTLDAVLSAGFRRVQITAEGPTGRPVRTAFAERDGTAVIELADVSGLRRLPGPAAPRTASSFGTGQVIRAALDAGCRRTILGIGGSACTDGGAGMVEALGGLLIGTATRGGAALATLERLDLTGLDARVRAAELVIASDVDNPLLGPRGAAAVYGPQKGATPHDIRDLEAGLSRWATVVHTATGVDAAATPGVGAAGGVGFAALAVLGARLRPGIDLILDLTGFEAHLRGAKLVITGEGSLDEQTLHGKAPLGVAARANRAGVPVIAVAGRCLLTRSAWRRAGIQAVYPLTDLEPDPQRSISRAGPLLTAIGRRIAQDVAGGDQVQ
jgi:glycerate kinase